MLAAVLALAVAGLDPASSAEVCGGCHRAIHDAWKTSAHARAMESRLFQDALEMAERDFGAGSRKICLGCHAPLAVHGADLGLVKKVSWEGVTCDFCHSVREVATTGPNPHATVQFTSVKTGPLKDAESGAHGTEFSAVHTSSRICAPCHEYRNPLGFAVLTTYSEWRNSAHAAQGRQCQSCHMAAVAGSVVDPRVKRASLAKINLHQMPGSHSLAQLTRTIRAQLYTARAGDKLNITVEVLNHGAGHYVPTGSPLRQLILEVRADTYDGKHFRDERVYARKVADQHGAAIGSEHVAFMKAAKVLSDTRLAPGEKRTETFAFPIAAGTQTQVRANLWYYYSPLERKESQKRISFLRLDRLVK